MYTRLMLSVAPDGQHAVPDLRSERIPRTYCQETVGGLLHVGILVHPDTSTHWEQGQ